MSLINSDMLLLDLAWEPGARYAQPSLDSTLAKLTAREREVLGWIAQGKRNREIGAIMSISPRTVQKHVQSILAKLCVETRGAAAAVWFAEIIRLK